jgi:3-hydroxyacyl-CoA dehydrogenase
MNMESIDSAVLLAGAGVVGTAIAEAHLSHGISIFLIDTNLDALRSSLDRLGSRGHVANDPSPFPAGGHIARVVPAALQADFHSDDRRNQVLPGDRGILIESIIENLAAKRDFHAAASRFLGTGFVYASNTSSLRLADIGTACCHPENFCGMHFLMPVKGRDLVELVRIDATNRDTLDRASDLIMEIGKHPLRVKDRPALLVNRLLLPYLNQGLALLERGVQHEQLRNVTRQFGMPLSPLEMIDMIGLRSAFNAGRVAWQAFPSRVEPSPILPGLIKANLQGWGGREGFYRYAADPDPADQADQIPTASADLSATASQVIQRYQRGVRSWSDDEVLLALIVPMMVEAAHVLIERIVAGTEQIEFAMSLGLGFKGSFFDSLDRIGVDAIVETLENNQDNFKSMRAPEHLIDCLRSNATVRGAIDCVPALVS